MIINGTLTRGENPEVIIASYAIAMSLFGITERLGVLLRNACSALVRDKVSFKVMTIVGAYVLTALMVVSGTIAYTPIGNWVFTTLFGANENMIAQIVDVYQILIIVTFFSAIRCLFQGVIIINRQTKWLTIGMVIRLIVMYLLSLVFINTGHINAKTGAYIFLAGMMIESIISFTEGRILVKKMVDDDKKHTITKKSQIFRFYNPLILSSLIIVMVGPVINVFLGKTNEIELAIASYAIALSITQLFLSFFTYTHQIVLTFYKDHPQKVQRFTLIIGFIPTGILSLFCFTPIGAFFIEHVLGANELLVMASLDSLNVFLLMTLVFPFIDFCNGLLMVRNKTKVMVLSQSANLLLTFLVLVITSSIVPYWNGKIGAIAQSIGMLTELCVLVFIIYRVEKKVCNEKPGKSKYING
ncbi:MULTISPECIES: multi antimicrobial extrusion protein MatE [Metabacillus]|uniref:Multi antimicrobial extrusion protein MatE n=1 Tax=Metabacillus hrfriensis TaxID=3048891 RepID=A0ACD4R6G5_9BACI|nr:MULTISPECIES: multi antimicrobial extrusion protein MatE [Metabacillus]UAL50569.1 multi antimicrobial extrusion protein MatE [Metabacillus dongyingensis]USK26833.1 multi antimicrobial extrusion protein MatE [Bacillus sp. CMF21]WHZ56061.1 multi antimicrobial extrusion protein MatE [Metabacillus sp. CT-WN-B3]